MVLKPDDLKDVGQKKHLQSFEIILHKRVNPFLKKGDEYVFIHRFKQT